MLWPLNSTRRGGIKIIVASILNDEVSNSTLLITLFASSCDRNKYVPQITLEEIGPDQVVALEDSIYMRIGFYDKDGDLGENFTDDRNLLFWITD